MSKENSPNFLIDVLDDYRAEEKGGVFRTLKVESNFVVGRDPSCNIQIKSDTVSLRHAEFVFEPENQSWRIKDLGSSNGIVASDVLHTDLKLSGGERLFLGEALLVIRMDEPCLEKTRSFTILRKNPNTIPHRGMILSSLTLACGLFVCLSTGYFQTSQAAVENLVGTFMEATILYLILLTVSWLNLRSFQFSRLGFFHIQALSIGYLFFELYSLISFSFFSTSADRILVTFLMFFSACLYLARFLFLIQRKPSAKRALGFSAAFCIFGFSILQLSQYQSERTLLETRFKHPLRLPPQTNGISHLGARLDQSYESASSSGGAMPSPQ
jgi:hypothetical protein